MIEDKSENDPIALLSFSEAAKRMGIGKDSLSELIRKGQLGIIKIGKRTKIPVREILNFIDENTMRAEQPQIINNQNNGYTFRSSIEIAYDLYEEHFGQVHPSRLRERKKAAEAAKLKLEK